MSGGAWDASAVSVELLRRGKNAVYVFRVSTSAVDVVAGLRRAGANGNLPSSVQYGFRFERGLFTPTVNGARSGAAAEYAASDTFTVGVVNNTIVWYRNGFGTQLLAGTSYPQTSDYELAAALFAVGDAIDDAYYTPVVVNGKGDVFAASEEGGTGVSDGAFALVGAASDATYGAATGGFVLNGSAGAHHRGGTHGQFVFRGVGGATVAGVGVGGAAGVFSLSGGAVGGFVQAGVAFAVGGFSLLGQSLGRTAHTVEGYFTLAGGAGAGAAGAAEGQFFLAGGASGAPVPVNALVLTLPSLIMTTNTPSGDTYSAATGSFVLTGSAGAHHRGGAHGQFVFRGVGGATVAGVGVGGAHGQFVLTGSAGAHHRGGAHGQFVFRGVGGATVAGVGVGGAHWQFVLTGSAGAHHRGGAHGQFVLTGSAGAHSTADEDIMPTDTLRPMFVDNFDSILGATLLVAGTSAMVLYAEGLPGVFSRSYAPLTITDGSTFEIVYVTARNGNTCTLLRAQEGTTALEWPAGTRVFQDATAETYNNMVFNGARAPTRLAMYGGFTRVVNTSNVGLLPAARSADDADDTGGAFALNNTSEVVVLSHPVDLTATGAVTVELPGTLFFPDEVGVILVSGSAITTQPSVSFGYPWETEGLLATVQTTALAAVNARERYKDLLFAGHAFPLQANVQIAAAATEMVGRFYWRGFAVQETET
jgi:hypothetical protein